MTVDHYLEADQPADPADRRGPPADHAGGEHLRRRRPSIARSSQHDHDHRNPPGPPPAAAGAVHRRVVVLRHRPRLPAAERRQHHPARAGQPAAGPDARPLRAGVPLPARRAGGRGKREAQAFRGFTLHIVLETLPNQPRGYTAADQPVYADNRGPNCLHLPNPPWSQSNPVRHQPELQGRHRQPDRQGHRPGRPVVRRAAGTGYAGGAAEAALLKRLLGPSLGCPRPCRPASSDPGVLLVGSDGPRARRCRCDDAASTPRPSPPWSSC